ncbi:MAG: DMT family transporter, partial [Alphaproteobacteria bacterium]|nr:DMT family transporter [Alphaproteobacteria bacterium]
VRRVVGYGDRAVAEHALALILAGQMLASLAFDHYGLFGIAPHPADLPRLAGAALLIAGVALIRL